jgi:hypothetical protein
MYVLSLLYSGLNATLFTGLAKFLSVTSLGSTRDCTHTSPSILDVPMKMLFDGVAGI